MSGNFSQQTFGISQHDLSCKQCWPCLCSSHYHTRVCGLSSSLKFLFQVSDCSALLPLSCSVRYQTVSDPARFYDIGTRVTWDVMSCLYWKTAPLFMGSHLVAFGIRGPQFGRHNVGLKAPWLLFRALSFFEHMPQEKGQPEILRVTNTA